MRLWADVYDAAGERLGDGPITTLTSARVTRALDGAGSVQVDAPLGDARAMALLQNENWLRVYLEEDGQTRELGRGVIKQVRLASSAGSETLSADGPDSLNALKNVNTLLARTFSTQPVETIAAALVALADDWTLDSDAGLPTISARFDGVSVLLALQKLAEQQGLHLRLGDAAQTVEFGTFGAASGVTLLNSQLAPDGVYDNDEIALVSQLTLQQSTEATANWLLPVGAGEGRAALTLEHSTRSSPYPIQSMTGPDGATLYYLVDTASVALYRQIQKVGAFKNIAPVSNSDNDILQAANALYDAAAAWLARSALRQDTYRTSIKKTRASLKPGDTIRLLYGNVVYDTDGQPIVKDSVDGTYWILRVGESVGPNGLTTDLEISTVDRHQQDAVRTVIGALEAIELRGVAVQPYPANRSWATEKAIDSSHTVRFPVKISDATLYLNRALLTISTRPLRSTVTGAAAGGGTTSSSGGGGTSGSGGSTTPTSSVETGSAVTTGPQNGVDTAHYHYYNSMESHSHTVSIPNHTHSVPAHTHTVPDHTHDMVYGIFDDTNYPQTLSLWIDGVDRTTALGGPWAATNAAVEIELEISDYLANAAGGLRQEHEIEVRCTTGTGMVEMQIELYEVIQAIRV